MEFLLIHTLRKFSHFEETILVLPQSEFDYWKELCNTYNFTQPHVLVAGGETRFDSVKNGLEKIEKNTLIAIHDGVRPLVSKALINSLMIEIKNGLGIIPVAPVKDSIRKVDGENSTHINKNKLYNVQTPQCFFGSDIKNAYTQGFSAHFTDDASVFESNRGKITAISGEERNLKITTKEDLKITEALA